MMTRRQEMIVVGVDGGPQGEAALRFAMAEAQSTGDTIEVVTAWAIKPSPVSPSGLVGSLPTLDELEHEARRNQDRSIELVLGRPPALEVASRVQRGDPGPILIEAARHARMLVVGSHGYGPVKAALLGSVSRYCAHHATCPVVVVPGVAEVAEPAEAVAVRP
jgi:nucleotide-binding universal stress UspA family protein